MYRCKMCEREFETVLGLQRHVCCIHRLSSKEYYDKFFNVNEGICLTCGKPTKYISLTKGYLKHCCVKCSSVDEKTYLKKKQTNLAKYGDENYRNKEKYEETCLKRYGSKNYLGTKDCVEKSKKTWLEKYGVDNPCKSDVVLDKIKQTNL